MATKYRVTVTFGLETRISPEGIERHFEPYNAEDYEDDSYFSEADVDLDGGQIRFTVEADSEDEAESKAEDAFSDGNEFEDDNGFAWVVAGCSYEVEALEWDPTVEEAIEVLQDFINEHLDEGSGEGQGRVAKAAEVVLTDHANLGRRVASLEERIGGLEEQIRQLSERLAQ